MEISKFERVVNERLEGGLPSTASATMDPSVAMHALEEASARSPKKMSEGKNLGKSEAVSMVKTRRILKFLGEEAYDHA